MTPEKRYMQVLPQKDPVVNSVIFYCVLVMSMPKEDQKYALHVKVIIYHLFTIFGTSTKCSVKTRADHVALKAVLKS